LPPPPRLIGRPRSTDLREVVNAIFYMATTGLCCDDVNGLAPRPARSVP
jgi:transposase